MTFVGHQVFTRGGGVVRPKEENLINWFKVVGGLKCDLIAGLIQDFQISRKSGQCLLLSEGFEQSYDQQTSPWEQQSPYRDEQSGERELWGAGAVLVWESFSQDWVGSWPGCVWRFHIAETCICIAQDFLGCPLERQQQWEQRGAALLVRTLQFSECRRWPPG